VRIPLLDETNFASTILYYIIPFALVELGNDKCIGTWEVAKLQARAGIETLIMLILANNTLGRLIVGRIGKQGVECYY
jgi:hypothetical protein